MDLAPAEISKTRWSADVYAPSEDSFALVDALAAQARRFSGRDLLTCLEVGTGSGYVIASWALMLQQLGIRHRCVATDISPQAVEAARHTLLAHGLGDSVQVVQSDLADGVSGDVKGAVDVLIFNPPYVPTPDEEVQQDGIARAWAGGYRGRRIIDRLLSQLDDLLAMGGEVFMVTVTENEPQGIISDMRERGYQGAVILSRTADEETLHIVHLVRGQG